MQKNTVKIKSAIDESLIDYFTLQSSIGSQPKILASGQIKRCDKDFIYVEIVEDDFDLLRNNADKQYFDIKFHINRVGYQLQHRALKYMGKHNLHSILIDNKQYDAHQDDVDVDYSLECSLDILSGKLAVNLNDEQRMAVKFITMSDNSLPYLLFGPAGYL